MRGGGNGGPASALGRGWCGGHYCSLLGAARTFSEQRGPKMPLVEPYKQAAAVPHIGLVVKVALHGAQLLGGPRGHNAFPVISVHAFVVDN